MKRREFLLGASAIATTALLPPVAASVIPDWEPEALGIFPHFVREPSFKKKQAINRLIRDLKAAGVWQKLDMLYAPDRGVDIDPRINWISPNQRIAIAA